MPFCCSATESFQHLLFDYGFSEDLWGWLKNMMNFSINPSSVEGWLQLCSCIASPQVAVVIYVVVINTFFQIWQIRNNVKHGKIKTNVVISKKGIMHQVKLSGNNSSRSSFINMKEYSIIKAFNVSIKPLKAPSIKEVIWTPPSFGWHKCNCDGAFSYGSLVAAGGGLFRNHNGNFVMDFAERLVCDSSLHVEFELLSKP